ncbi:MAG: CxxxxCH/CxxCH domain-containing protein [Deltaproteobacteria bacterium]|nr:CxxxxCH/CxxCH domain-containing protein [Deltaproteobacteria bacterium]
METTRLTILTSCFFFFIFACRDVHADNCSQQTSLPSDCSACHGTPPDTPRHPPNTLCYRCHGYVIDSSFTIIAPGLHQNGSVEYAVGCSSCHGWDQGISPPESLRSDCAPGLQGTGAHQAMRRDCIPAHQTGCSNCHSVPTTTWQDGHIDGDNTAEVTFSLLAVADGATPSWDGSTCSGVYCHGATLQGGSHTAPGWHDTSGTAGTCGACHRLTDPRGNSGADCSSCHPTSIDRDRKILPYGTHINGTVDVTEEK